MKVRLIAAALVAALSLALVTPARAQSSAPPPQPPGPTPNTIVQQGKDYAVSVNWTAPSVSAVFSKNASKVFYVLLTDCKVDGKVIELCLKNFLLHNVAPKVPDSWVGCSPFPWPFNLGCIEIVNIRRHFIEDVYNRAGLSHAVYSARVKNQCFKWYFWPGNDRRWTYGLMDCKQAFPS